MTAPAAAPPRRLHYAWIVFGVAFATLLLAAGFRSAIGVLIDPLRDEFGWSRATVSLATSINVLLFGFMGPFAAALQGKYGLRRVTVIALAVVSSGAFATAFVTHPWQLYLLWGVVVGAGNGCMATVFASTVASRWFVAHRGLVTGALTAATASGQLVFLPLLGYIANDVGWQWVGVVIGAGALGALPLVALFLRNSPESVGLLPLGAPVGYEPVGRTQHPIRAAFEGLGLAWRMGSFWLLWGSFMVCGLSTNGLIQTHFVSAAHDHGLSATSAGSLLALVGVFDIIGTVTSGWFTDRVDPRRLLVVYYGLRGLSLVALQHAFDTSRLGLVAFIVFYGLDWVATVPPTIALCNELVGRERGPIVYGWVFAGHQIGAAIASWGAGKIRDVTGSYQAAFVAAGLCCLVAALGVTQIRRPDALEPEPVTVGPAPEPAVA